MSITQSTPLRGCKRREFAEAGAMRERAVGNTTPKNIWSTVYFAVFFVLFFLYVWLWIDPSLLYHGVGLTMVIGWSIPSYSQVLFPFFSWSPSFLKGFLLYPGGPVEYLSALLSQYYYYPWAGALIITAVAALLGLATSTFMKAVVGAQIPLARFIPAIFVLVLCNQYEHQLAVLGGMLVALLAVCVYVRTVGRGNAVRFATFLALAVPLYYIAGGAYLLYAVLCGLFEFRSKQGRLLALWYIILAGVLPYAFGIYVSHLSLTDAYARLLPSHPNTEWWWWQPGVEVSNQIPVLGLYLFLVLTAVGGVLWQWMAVASELRAAVEPKPMAHSVNSSRMRRFLECLLNLKVRPGAELALVLVAAAVAVLLSFDSGNRRLLRTNRFASEEMWAEVLQEADGLSHYQCFCTASHAINRALYEMGRLPYEMFSYPQHPYAFTLGWSLLARQDLQRVHETSFFQLGDLTLQLGLVNEAEREARDALANFGDYPLILKRLALINIVKGQPEAAKVFLRALSTYMHYGDWARAALWRLQADPLWSTDLQIERIRSVMILDESAIFGMSGENTLEELLQRNPYNRMAFEYKMMFYLLTRKLETFVGELNRLGDFDYPDIPRHYEEAILVYEHLSSQKVDLHGRQISPQTRLAFGEFRARWGPDGGDWEGLATRFGDTYFFYYLFNLSGVTPG